MPPRNPRTTSTTTTATPSKGRSANSKNWTPAQLGIMLQQVRSVLPRGAHDWQQITYQYNNVTKENAEVLRIKKKFNSLANVRKPTGGALMPATVSEAKKIRQLIDERIGSGIEGIPTSSSIGDDNADDGNAVSFNNSQVYDNDALNDDHNDIDIEPTQPLPALPSTLLQSAQSNVSAVLQQLDPTATSTTTTATSTAVPATPVPVYTLSSPNAVNKRKRSNNDIMSSALQAATASETSNNNNMMSMMLQQERMMMMMMNQQRTEHREMMMAMMSMINNNNNNSSASSKRQNVSDSIQLDEHED